MIRNAPNWKELDGNPKTIGEYIQSYHFNRTCTCDNCLLCDYERKRPMLEIKDAHKIYSIDILKKYQKEKLNVLF
jgi:hypothetical protein